MTIHPGKIVFSLLAILSALTTGAVHAATITWTPVRLPVAAVPANATVSLQVVSNLMPSGQLVQAGNYTTADGQPKQYIVVSNNGIDKILVGDKGKYGSSLALAPDETINAVVVNTAGHVAFSTNNATGDKAGAYFLGGGGLQTIVPLGQTHVTFPGSATQSYIYLSDMMLNVKDQVVVNVTNSSADYSLYSTEIYTFTPTLGTQYLGSGANKTISLNQTGSIYYTLIDNNGVDQVYAGAFGNATLVPSVNVPAPGYPGLTATYSGYWIDHGNSFFSTATLSGPGVTDLNNTVLYRGLPTALKPIARTGQSINTSLGKATFVGLGFGRVRVSSSANFTFTASYTLDNDPTQKIYAGLFYAKKHVITEVLGSELMINPDLAPGSIAINRNDDILVIERDTSGLTNDGKLLLSSAGQSLQTVLATGQIFDIASNDRRTVNQFYYNTYRFGFNSGPNALSNVETFLVSISFTDGTNGQYIGHIQNGIGAAQPK